MKSITLIYTLLILSVAATAQVMSLGLSLPASVFSITGSPVTSIGTLTGTFINQTANRFFAAPDGSTGVPTFRLIVADDLPEAGLTNRGIVNITTQTFAGAKTFNSDVALTTGNLLFGTTLYVHHSGNEGFFAGEDAGFSTPTGNGNTGIGYHALYLLAADTAASHNTSVGWLSLSNGTKGMNTMVGSRGGQSITTGEMNTGIGWNVFYTGGTANTTGGENVAIGAEAAIGLTSGSNNTFIGRSTGSVVTTGSGNIFIGSDITGAAVSENDINIGAAWFGDRTAQNLGIGVASPAAVLHVKAGTATANTAPLKFTSGTNLTTPEAGVIEYDGNGFYSTLNANSGRGVIPSVAFTSNSSDVSMNNNTTAQSVFDAARDAFTVNASTTYYFEAQYIITGMGSTARGIKTLFAGSSSITINYSSMAWGGTVSDLSSDQRTVNITTTSATPTLHPNLYTEAIIQLKGIIRVTTGGTLIPQIQFSAAPGGTIVGATNSYFLIYPL
ncbi:MAG: hypothetical protein ACKVPJ_09335, partial [Chitinophagales bacterium]